MERTEIAIQDYLGFQCFGVNFTQWVHGTYGNCYTFKVNLNRFPSTITGSTSGLKIQLYAQYEEYLPGVTSSAGFKIEIHGRDAIPFPEENGFNISPGTTTLAGVKELVLKVKILDKCYIHLL
jgi:hypothetical protein